MEKLISVYEKYSTYWVGKDNLGNLYHKAFDEKTPDKDKKKFGWIMGKNCNPSGSK